MDIEWTPKKSIVNCSSFWEEFSTSEPAIKEALITKPTVSRLIPLSILGGAAALLAADTLARIILAPQTLPVGIVTALAGAPFFLWILRKAKTEVFW